MYVHAAELVNRRYAILTAHQQTRALFFVSQVLLDADVLRQLTPADLDACKALLMHMGEHRMAAGKDSETLYQVRFTQSANTRTGLRSAVGDPLPPC